MCRTVLPSAILFVSLCTASPAVIAQGCCGGYRPRSILTELADAKIIVIGTFQNAVKPNNALPNGQVEYKIDAVLKAHEVIKDRRTVIIPRFMESTKKYLIAGDVFKGQFDPYFGRELDADGEMERFVRGAMQLKDKDALAKLRYCVGFLLNSNADVATSAVLEFKDASYDDARTIARTLNPDDFVKPLQNAATDPLFRIAFAQIIGHCGKKEHAAVIAKLLKAAEAKGVSFESELFITYVHLDPDAGRKSVMRILDKPDAPFLLRYAAYDAVRRLRDSRPDLVSATLAKDAVGKLLPDPLMADFAIESFHRWKCWDVCDDVMALVHSKTHQTPIIKKAILRFALQCPLPQAKAHVIQMQAQDAAWVEETRELLELEAKILPTKR